MPRPKRITKGNVIYHALNRANGKLRIFKKPRDFEAFEEINLTNENMVSVAAGPSKIITVEIKVK